MRAATRTASALTFVVVALTLRAQEPAPRFDIRFDPLADVTLLDVNDSGQAGLFVRVRFAVDVQGATPADARARYRIRVEENGRRVHEDDVPAPRLVDDFSLVVALDSSGSMAEGGRMTQARAAAERFLASLPEAAECGLVLFDHEVRTPTLPPARDREPLRRALAETAPAGGTAYFDAAARAVDLLAACDPKRQRHLVLLTDGVDLNSVATLDAVVQKARAAQVRIVTLGVGEPGTQQPTSTVLVLDQSASMRAPADERDRTSKLAALQRAATRFVSILPPTAAVSILPFDSVPRPPSEFTADRAALGKRVADLRATGDTALLDATYSAVAALDAAQRPGRKAVVAMTDGIDNRSRRRVDEVVARAREAGVPIHALGLGRDREIDAKTLGRLASETGGAYYRARNERSLVEIFENLALRLHDDGVDETSLRRLAQGTGGRYLSVKDASDLHGAFAQVSGEIQSRAYEVTFPSLLQTRDGSRRRIELKLVRRDGSAERLVETKGGAYQTRGLVLAETHPLVFLAFFAGLVALLAWPTLRAGRDAP